MHNDRKETKHQWQIRMEENRFSRVDIRMCSYTRAD